MSEWIIDTIFYVSLAVAVVFGIIWISKHIKRKRLWLLQSAMSKSQNSESPGIQLIPIESIPVSQFVLLLITYALAGKRFEKVDRNNTEEYIEVLIFYVFAVDLGLFGSVSKSALLNEYRDEMYALIVDIVKKIAPAIESRVFLKQMDSRFSFYAQSYNKMMRPGGNSAQMSLDLRITIPRVGSDLFLGMAVYGEFMDILLHVNSFLKDGIPKNIVIDILERHVS